MKASEHIVRDTLTALYATFQVGRYKLNGRRPWSVGYWHYHRTKIVEYLSNPHIMSEFERLSPLHAGYGIGLDERVVELPWLVSRLKQKDALLLDAGSTLNHKHLLLRDEFMCRKIVCMTLSLEHRFRLSHVSYIQGDLRKTLFRDSVFDEIVCISVLEHIGMDNTLIYTSDTSYKEANYDHYLDVIREFARLLKPNGRLFFSVPFGRYENHGWLQQFDRSMLEKIYEAFEAQPASEIFYRYDKTGWQAATVMSI